MIVDDEDKAKKYLSHIGYYRLSGYWLVYEKPPADGRVRSKEFVPDASFEEVLELYIFDRKLRLLLMEAIDRIEVSLRSRWSNRFSLEYGAHGYINPDNFDCPWKHAENLNKVTNRIGQSKEVYHTYYKGKYSSPFLTHIWGATQTMTMTELINWYSSTKDQRIKKFVARDIGFPNKEVAESALSSFRYIRNICAHHGMLWNRNIVVMLCRIKKFDSDMAFTEYPMPDGNIRKSPNSTIYNVLVVIMHVIRVQNTESSFPERVKKLIDDRTDFQRDQMGFPRGWQDRPVWKNS